MEKFFSKRNFEILVILLLGLTPLLWFRGSEVILGHDAGLPIFPVTHFIDRLSVWTHRFGFGRDQTEALPGFFIHGIEAAISFLGIPLQLEQKVIFIFWFILPGITMYLFARSLQKKLNLHYFVLPVVTFYMFNHFLLQGWFIVERTKFSLYAALPLVMMFLFDWEEKKRSTLRTVLFISLTFFFLNGEASLPLFGGMIISVISFLFFYLKNGISKDKLTALTKLFAGIFCVSFVLNAYWLLTYLYFVFHSYSDVVKEVGGLGGVLTWINYISKESSLMNLFRLQGIPEWYQNQHHAYASFFLSNKFIISLSFLIPLLAFFSLAIVNKQKPRKYILFFSFLALFSMMFISGSHPPFGAIYVFLVNIIPGFIAFRTPFYKFASALWFSYALLLGFSLNYFLSKFSEKSTFFANIGYGFFCIGIILYSFPFLNGQFFNYIVGQRSMKVVVPAYVFDFAKWEKSHQNNESKVFLLPQVNFENKVDTYTWGYWSLTPLTSLLTDAPIVNKLGMSKQELQITERLDTLIFKNDPTWENIAKLLGIKFFLLQKDFLWNQEGSKTNNPQSYEAALHSRDVRLVKSFGQWELYELKAENKNDEVTATNEIAYVNGTIEQISDVASLPNFQPNQVIFISDRNKTQYEDEVLQLTKYIYTKASCIMCNLQYDYIDQASFLPTFTSNSIFYPLITIIKEKEERNLNQTNSLKLEFLTEESLRNEKGIERLLDEKKGSEQIEKQLSEYTTTLKKLDSVLRNFSPEEQLENNSILLKTHNFLRIEQINITYIAGTLLGKVSDKEINQVFDLINNSFQLSTEKTWYTTDLTNKKYLLSIPKEEKYSLLVKSNTLSAQNASIEKEITYAIDNEQFVSRATSFGNGWYSLGDVILKKGLHKLRIVDSATTVVDMPTDITVVGRSDQVSNCYSFPGVKADAGSIFRLSFLYRQIRGFTKFYINVNQNNVPILTFSERGTNLKNSREWEKFEMDYGTPDSNGLYYYVCTRPDLTRVEFDSILELKDVKLNRITSPEVLAMASVQKSPGPRINLTSRAANKTFYNLAADANLNKKVIVLGESFNPNWTLKKLNGDHFVANGYANAWFVKSDGSAFSIEYTPQKLVVSGFFISFFAFTGVVLIGIFLYMKDRLK